MIRTNDGKVLHSTAPDAIVKELHDMSFTPEANDRAFMLASANRILQFSGRKIRTDTTANYVEDLFEYGFLSTDEGPAKPAD